MVTTGIAKALPDETLIFPTKLLVTMLEDATSARPSPSKSASARKNGALPEFFYTNEQQETIGFDRSDLIIAIKQYEKHIIQTMTRNSVLCLPYWDDRSVDRSNPVVRANGYDHERPLRLGFIGAHNSINIINIQRFLETFACYVKLYNLAVKMVIAGNVCRGIDQEYFFLNSTCVTGR